LKIGGREVTALFKFCGTIFHEKTPLWGKTKKRRKWPYLTPETRNLKNKSTFFSSSLKVEENKVLLFFGFGASGLRYGHFLIFLV